MSPLIDRFVAYYRVSTAKQGASGLGLAAQRSAVEAYLKQGRVIAEFTEVESGRRTDRRALEQALAAARIHRVPLVVAKVDRLTRSVGFLSRLLESGVEVRFADLPAIEGPTGRFMLQQMAAVAELEAGLISTRTKAALIAAKKRGVRLGGHRGTSISQSAQAASRLVRSRRATQRANDLLPVIEELRRQGITSAEGLARALTARGIPTSRGRAKWSGVQVGRMLHHHRQDTCKPDLNGRGT
ncbi:recombinase family protein [Bradyrhizobium sp. CCBAU 25360]|uniref:recombinase family protein n=1 Tax=Bradyrhizobium sp. CCBAU 25360 TaxID=858425 RepID=UPI002305D9BC|nr:recombinase family protein [Bradyrhizobium sp. CCBAU 25360]